MTPQNLADMAESVAIAKWTIRNTCAMHGVSVSFSPKVHVEHAGSGMHVHLCAIKGGKNTVANPDGTLSGEAIRMIGGMLKFAPSLSAFSNPKPVSYVRFAARKESPMQICWSAKDRLALIRIPLWWSFRKGRERIDVDRETVEYRAPDAFANPYLLLAGIAVAVNYGLTSKEEALELASRLRISKTRRERKTLKTLPRSCNESAQNLEKDRELYEAEGVFPRELIDKTIETLKSYRDRNLWRELANKPDRINDVLEQYLHYG